MLARCMSLSLQMAYLRESSPQTMNLFAWISFSSFHLDDSGHRSGLSLDQRHDADLLVSIYRHYRYTQVQDQG